MSKLMHQLLMLSGFYFILSFILNTWKNSVTYYAFIALFVVFVVLFIVLCFKKNFIFLDKFDANNPKVSNYLKAVGGAQYFNVLFGLIPGFFFDAKHGLPLYFKYASIVYLILLFAFLAQATYVNFFKEKVDKGTKNSAKKASTKKAAKK